MKIGFVILCFGKYEMVAECLERLLKMNRISEHDIIIVDNCSPDGTGQRLLEQYGKMDHVYVLLNQANEGFAKGNNIGYQFAKETLKCDCIIAMNSDVFIDDIDFISHLENCVEEEPDAAIIAPDVVGQYGRHTNPLRKKKPTKNQVRKDILVNIIAISLLKIHFNYFNYFKYRSRKNKKEDLSVPVKQYGIMPHGSCIIFCRSWIAKEDIAFYNGTFLFGEEMFLQSYALTMGYHIVYMPSIAVLHIGDASIDANYKTERKKRIFICRNHIKSLRKYLQFERNIKDNWNK